jgi:hypothetical protein
MPQRGGAFGAEVPDFVRVFCIGDDVIMSRQVDASAAGIQRARRVWTTVTVSRRATAVIVKPGPVGHDESRTEADCSWWFSPRRVLSLANPPEPVQFHP